jgi:hypothetical protein
MAYLLTSNSLTPEWFLLLSDYIFCEIAQFQRTLSHFEPLYRNYRFHHSIGFVALGGARLGGNQNCLLIFFITKSLAASSDFYPN